MKCELCTGKSKYEVDSCLVNSALRLAGTKWVLPLLLELKLNNRPTRFGELEKALFPITPKILSARLRLLEEKGMISRNQLRSMPQPIVEYALTEKGRAFALAVNPVIDFYRKFEANAKVCRVLK